MLLHVEEEEEGKLINAFMRVNTVCGNHYK